MINAKLFSVSSFFLLGGEEILTDNFKNGTGLLIDYHDDGSIFSKSHYTNGLLNGLYEEYFSNGRKAKYGEFRDNFKIGEWSDFNKRGKLITKINYD